MLTRRQGYYPIAFLRQKETTPHSVVKPPKKHILTKHLQTVLPNDAMGRRFQIKQSKRPFIHIK